MQKINFFLLCIFCTTTAFGQFYYSTAFFNYDTLPCPFDNTKTLVFPKGWYLYQTTDDTWAGPVDSSRCIGVEPFAPFDQPRIDLSQIDPQKALFLRARPSEFAGQPSLEPNALYNAGISFHVSDAATLPVPGTGCIEDMCTGLFIGIAVPGPQRIQTGVLNGGNFPPNYFYRDINTCFPTEYFFSQNLNELVAKFTFPPGADLNGHYLYLDYASVEPGNGPPGLISEVTVGPNNYNSTTGEYDINVEDAVSNGGFFFENFILQYTAPTFPSAQEPSYVIGSIDPNSPEQETINLIVSPFQTLEIQPFTYLAGALVAGSDTLRHLVNLVNNGGDICMNFVDFVVGGGDEFRYGSGSLYMNNAFSCMKFRSESALRVLEGSTLHYGNDGTGMLALCAGSTIALERNATMIVDGVLNMSECNNDIPPQQLYMDLPPGSKLIFTDKARLTNRYSQGQQMHLNVRMLGGTIDDAALAPEDRELIRRIYPEPSVEFADNVSIAPNPFADVFSLIYLAGKPETLALRWTSISGQTIREETRQALPGPNEWQPDTPETAGVYLLTVESESGRVTKKVVKLGKQ